MSNIKTINIGNKKYSITGVSETDGYFKAIEENYERKFQDFCRVFLNKDSIALDIGANIGVTSLIISHYLSEGKVFSLEPGKNVFTLLKKNITDNNVSNITAINYAVSDKSQRVSFLENSAWGHIDSSIGNIEVDEASETSVMAYSIDDLVEKLDLKRVDFIKIDTEGFEPQAFSGAIKTIERFQPIIYFELNTWCILDRGITNPVDFMHQITNSFDYVYRVYQREDSPIILENFQSNGSYRTLVHDNILFYGSVNDIVVTNDPIKLHPWALEQAIMNDALRTELNNISSERDALRKELSVIKSSKSFRYTSFLRSIRRLFS
jgi:FkbM family methyltransferase